MGISAQGKDFDLASPFGISRGAKSTAKIFEVSVTEGEITGLGEGVPYSRYGDSVELALAQLATLPPDFDPHNLEQHLPAGSARNALDLAVLDGTAKFEKRPIWEILDLPEPKPLAFGATVSLKSTSEMIADAKSKSKESILKIKLGGDEDMNAMKGIRDAAPDSKLLIDVNEGWDFRELFEYLPTLIDLGVELIEQPLKSEFDQQLEDIDSPIPICADESLSPETDLESLIGRFDVINFKLDKSGGLTTMVKQVGLARELGFGVMVGCMVSSSLAIAPAFYAAQLADFVDLDGFVHLANDRQESMQVVDGFINADKTSWGKP